MILNEHESFEFNEWLRIQCIIIREISEIRVQKKENNKFDSMKKSILALAALALLAWGCSSDGDGTSTQPTPPTPTPTEIPAGTDTRPTWQSPNYDLYEQTMIVEVQLQDTLAKYASAQDLMSATIGSEVRGVAEAQQNDGNWVFPLIIASNNAGVATELSYYCDKLHRIFSIQWTTFDASVAPTGTGGIYQPEFVKQ